MTLPSVLKRTTWPSLVTCARTPAAGNSTRLKVRAWEAMVPPRYSVSPIRSPQDERPVNINQPSPMSREP